MKRKEFLRLAGAAAAGSLFAPGPAVRDVWVGAEGKTRVTVKLYELKLRQAWGLSRGTWTTRRNAYVRIERDGVVGLGEAAPIARYNETAESAAAGQRQTEVPRFDPFGQDRPAEERGAAKKRQEAKPDDGQREC